jgi:TRAP-type C4-dicarboxylate transport system permease small subunit
MADSDNARMTGPLARGLRLLQQLESAIAILALALIAGMLFADLIGRELFGRGIFIAQRFAVYCMIVTAFLGFSLAVGWRSHLGIEIAARLTPPVWDRGMERIADAVAAAACLFLAYWSWRFVAGSFADQARGQGFDILVWPVQAVLVWSFISSAVRHLAFAAQPALRGLNAEG